MANLFDKLDATQGTEEGGNLFDKLTPSRNVTAEHQPGEPIAPKLGLSDLPAVYGKAVAKEFMDNIKSIQERQGKKKFALDPLNALGAVFSPITAAVSLPFERGPEILQEHKELEPYAQIAVAMGMGLPATAGRFAKAAGALGVGKPQQSLMEQSVRMIQSNPKLFGIKTGGVVRTQLRQMLAKTAYKVESIWQENARTWAWMEGWKPEKGLAFIRQMELGKTSAKDMALVDAARADDLSRIAGQYRARLNALHTAEADYGDMKNFLEEYFPHYFQDPKEAQNWVNNTVNKLGKPGFQKKRVFDFLDDAIAAGLKPITMNPEQLVIMRENASFQWRHGKEFMNNMKEQGLLKAFPVSSIPKGRQAIKSPYLPPLAIINKIPEIDPLTIEQLKLKPLEELKDEARLWGVNTKALEAERLQFMIRNEPRLKGIIGRAITGAMRTMGRKLNPEEIRTIAQGAVKSLGFTDEMEKAQVIEGMKPFVLNRVWTLPDEGAKIVNRFLEPSLWRHPAFRGYMKAKNIRTAIVLGLNGFHAISTTLSDMASMTTLGMKNLGRAIEQRDPKFLKKAVGNFLMAPISPLRSVRKGVDPISDYLQGIDTEATRLIIRGGGRVKLGKEFTVGFENAARTAFSAMKEENYWKGAKSIVPGVTEALSYPVLGWYVPRLKVQTYINLAQDYVMNNTHLSEPQIDKGLAKIWDSVDNRFGQLVYDNLFWKRMARDLSVGAMLSMGWNFGTWREFGGAAMDATRMGIAGGAGVLDKMRGLPVDWKGNMAKIKPETWDRILFSLAYPVTVGTIGGLMHYAMSGKAPEKPIDYYYPKTGRLNRAGNDERLTIPSMMKEGFGVTEAYRKEGPMGLGTFVVHKMNPNLAFTVDLLRNKNFYNEEIWTPNSPIMQQAGEIATALWKASEPISIQTTQKQDLGYILPLAGFSSAPRFITSPKTQLEIADLYEKRIGVGTKTRERGERNEALREVKNLIYDKKVGEAYTKYRELQKQGLTKEPWHKYLKSVKTPSDIYMFKRLPEEDQRDLLKRMTTDERKKYGRFVKKHFRYWEDVNESQR